MASTRVFHIPFFFFLFLIINNINLLDWDEKKHVGLPRRAMRIVDLATNCRSAGIRQRGTFGLPYFATQHKSPAYRVSAPAVSLSLSATALLPRISPPCPFPPSFPTPNSGKGAPTTYVSTTPPCMTPEKSTWRTSGGEVEGPKKFFLSLPRVSSQPRLSCKPRLALTQQRSQQSVLVHTYL